MATITKGITFASGDAVTPSKLHQLVDSATIANIVTADIADGAVTTAKIADAQITQAKLAPTVILVPTGAVVPFAMNAAPTGWLAADGSAVARSGVSGYPALFAAIGTTYGAGDGSTTFNLPDLRGYFVRGAGTNSDGKAAGTFGAKQADAVIAHTHSGTTGNDSPDHTHSANGIGGSWGGGDGFGGPAQTLQSVGNTSGASTRHQHAFTTSSQSPAGATETRPANIALLYCIKF